MSRRQIVNKAVMCRSVGHALQGHIWAWRRVRLWQHEESGIDHPCMHLPLPLHCCLGKLQFHLGKHLHVTKFMIDCACCCRLTFTAALGNKLLPSAASTRQQYPQGMSSIQTGMLSLHPLPVAESVSIDDLDASWCCQRPYRQTRVESRY